MLNLGEGAIAYSLFLLEILVCSGSQNLVYIRIT